MKTYGFFRRNGLSLVALALMLASLLGQVIAGRLVYNQERTEHGAAEVSMAAYLRSGHFVSATFENWESEFLQMGMFVLLSVSLRQKGSAGSGPMDPAQEDAKVEAGPPPWPVKAGGLWLKFYEHSLAIAFGLLFLGSFILHLEGSWRHDTATRALQGQPSFGLLDTLANCNSGSSPSRTGKANSRRWVRWSC